jgi:hypothetical protein
MFALLSAFVTLPSNAPHLVAQRTLPYLPLITFVRTIYKHGSPWEKIKMTIQSLELATNDYGMACNMIINR